MIEEKKKGSVKLVIEVKDMLWDELRDLVEYLSDNPQNAVVQVFIGDQVFDA